MHLVVPRVSVMDSLRPFWWQFHVRTASDVVPPWLKIFLLKPSLNTIAVASHPKCSCRHEPAADDPEPGSHPECLHRNNLRFVGQDS